MQKLYQEKKILKYPKFWGVDLRSFQKCGVMTPATPPSAMPLGTSIYIEDPIDYGLDDLFTKYNNYITYVEDILA